MARVTPQEYAEKWARRTGAATEDYKRGINRVTVAPGQAAAQKVDKMRAGINEALDSGRWEERVASVPLNEWKQAAAEKGAGRISSGVQGATQKQQRFAAELLAYEDNLKSQVDAMPDNTFEERVLKSAAWQRGMHAFRRSR